MKRLRAGTYFLKKQRMQWVAGAKQSNQGKLLTNWSVTCQHAENRGTDGRHLLSREQRTQCVNRYKKE
jgi:hypothetical protein